MKNSHALPLLLAAGLFYGCSSSEKSAESSSLHVGESSVQDRDAIAAAAPTPATAEVTSQPTAQPTATAEAEVVKKPDVIYVPTPQPVVDKMLELAQVKKTDVVYDLGCGDGRIVVAAAKKFGVKAFGFDIDPQRVKEANENVKNAGVEHLVTIQQADIFTLDLSPADVVTLYLLPELNVRLIPQLQKLKKGARIVSHDFDMQGVSPIRHLALKPPNEEREHEIYLWRAPIKQAPATVSAK